MTLADITHSAVAAALDEFDRVGRDAFLKANGFGRARTYYVDRGGQLYDSKAIAGYAHGAATGVYLRSNDFAGGEQTVATRLRALGWTVRSLANPDWTRDEIILACELVANNAWRGLDDHDRRVIELSALLQSSVIHPFDQRGPDFRNPAGVGRKTSDIATRHDDYKGTPTNGNRRDREVLADFLARPDEMHAQAAALRAALATDDTDSHAVTDLDEFAAEEGGVLLRQHLRRERDPKLRARKIAVVRKRGQPVACEVCGFDFERTYGDRGRDYIECHHRMPLHVSGRTTTTLDDLALVCSNCHRMIHRTKAWILPEELKRVVDERR